MLAASGRPIFQSGLFHEEGLTSMQRSASIQNTRRRAAITVFTFLCVMAALLSAGVAQEARQRFVVTDLWVKDVETGLVWSRDANPSGRVMSWDDAVDFVGMLNEQKYAGHSDWKLPDIDELKKFLAAVKDAGGVDSFSGSTTVVSILKRIGFSNALAGDYWSSTKSIYNDTEAWYVNMKYGARSAGNTSLYMGVWPVRREE
jgi:hypothetical protein